MRLDIKAIQPKQMLEREDFDGIPAIEQGMVANESRPLVSVLMIAFNHDKYIAEAIENILSQQCGFPFEVIIGEDCSNDNTGSICEAYQRRYPDIVRLVYAGKNVGMHRNLARIWHRARGDYIALCEGDDYWTDPNKLAKQTAFLDARPDFTLCGAYTQKIEQKHDGTWALAGIVGPPAVKERYALDDLIPNYSFHTSSVLIRKNCVRFPRWFWDVYCADRPLYLLCAEQGPVGLIPEVMSVYRQHDGGIWSPLHLTEKAKRGKKLFATLDDYFRYRYSELFKRTLSNILWFYMSQAIESGERSAAKILFWQSLNGNVGIVRQIPKTVFAVWLRLYAPHLYQRLRTLPS